MASIKDFGPQLDLLLVELSKRTTLAQRHQKYLDGCAPVPQAVRSARLTKAYDLLMPMSNAPWASTIVDSKQDRLEVGGIRTGDADLDRLIWRQVWQNNEMDAESKLGHQGILTNGRVFATIWPDTDDHDQVEIVLDGADQMVVQYREGRHRARHRVAALRSWKDETDRRYVTLYRKDGIYKFVESREQTDNAERVQADGTWFEQLEVPDEPWPVANPFGVLNVIEVLTNRRLQAGAFPYARGEFQHHVGLLDRINLLTFLGLVVAVWMGFPLRGVIGDKILRDDDDNPLPPFESKPDEIFQFENPNAKIEEFKAADRKNLSIFDELAQLAYSTKTPAHYFPMGTGLSNISADMIRALEGGMHAQVDGIHKPFIGSGWEEVLRVGGLMLPDPVDVPREAELAWVDKQSRSLAEMADAAGKLKEILPNVMIAEKYLGFTQEEIGRMQSAMAGSALDRLLQAAQEPAPAVANGNGVAG